MTPRSADVVRLRTSSTLKAPAWSHSTNQVVDELTPRISRPDRANSKQQRRLVEASATGGASDPLSRATEANCRASSSTRIVVPYSRRNGSKGAKSTNDRGASALLGGIASSAPGGALDAYAHHCVVKSPADLDHALQLGVIDISVGRLRQAVLLVGQVLGVGQFEHDQARHLLVVRDAEHLLEPGVIFDLARLGDQDMAVAALRSAGNDLPFVVDQREQIQLSEIDVGRGPIGRVERIPMVWMSVFGSSPLFVVVTSSQSMPPHTWRR